MHLRQNITLIAYLFPMKPILSLLIFTSFTQASTHEVIIQDNSFSPSSLSIKAGDTVRWENIGFNAHNIASRGIGNDFRCANGCDYNGGNGDADISWISEVTFHKTNNNIPYVCEPHESTMTGSIQVRSAHYKTVTINPVSGFQPQQINLYKGTRVLFINQGGDHNIKADDDSFQCADGCRNDGMNSNPFYNGGNWQIHLLFNQIGSFSYHCENPAHTETGVIHVIEEPPIFANGFESP